MVCNEMVVGRFRRYAASVFAARLLRGLGWNAVADTGPDGWLRYAPITDRAVRERYATLPAVVVAVKESPMTLAARDELIRGIRGMLGRTPRSAKELPAEGAIVLGTFDQVTA